MKTKLVILLLVFGHTLPGQNKVVIFHDDFISTPRVSNTMWHIPTWTGPSDGTYFGRTQVRCSQNSPVPNTSLGNAVVNLDTYNPTGFSIYGTDLISNRSFSPGNGLVFKIRAKIQAPVIGGIVGGIFLYNNKVLPNHDEIDFELLTNQLNYVHTNVYSNEPLGVGHPDSLLVTKDITNYHNYEIQWKKDSVLWFVDGKLAKINTKIVPTGSMFFHLNLWAPDTEWPSAYNSDLKAVSSAALNSTYSMIVDYVRVDSIVNRGVSSDATLKNLHISQGTLNPVFNPNQLSYNVSVANNVTNLTVTPTLNTTSSLLKVNGNVLPNGQSSAPITCNVGNNTIAVSLMAEDGTEKTYIITVNRELSSDADLSDLSLDIVASEPKFSPNDTIYTAGRIIYDQTSVQVYTVLHDPNATFKVNGKSGSSGKLSDPIALSVGNNTITVVATAVDGSTKTYKILARRLNNDVELSNLNISPGTLSPVFSSDTTVYTGTVAKNVTSVMFTPTLSDPNATVTVGGIVVPNEKPSNPIELSSGLNGISILVSSEDMMKSKTYSIFINAANTDARLINLILSQGVLNPTFEHDVLNYTVSVANNISNITVTPFLNDLRASVKVNGVFLTNAKPSNPIPLNIGANTVTLVVTAENEVDSNTYTIVVTRCEPKFKFNKGWNIFSTSNTQANPDIKSIFQEMIDRGSLVKIQDELGNSLEDWGIFGGWINNIGNNYPGKGYKIKVSADDSLEIIGLPVELPFAIPLKRGWNIVGYPQLTGYDGMLIIQHLIDRSTLVKVQDERGNSIENWGIFGGWQNNIGNFERGEGYKIKVESDDTLWIYDRYQKSTTVLPEMATTAHFHPAFEGNGVDHMNFNLAGLPTNFLQTGDELGIFDGPTCVGAVTLMQHHLFSQTVSIAASAKDEQGMPGFSKGNQIMLKLWDSQNNKEFVLEPEILKGASKFTKHETTFASLDKYATTGLPGIMDLNNSEINCYPNPFNDEITFEIKLKTDAEVSMEVLNQLGQRIQNIVSKKQLTSGVYRLTWNGRDVSNREVSPGIYHVRLNIDEFNIHKKIVYSK